MTYAEVLRDEIRRVVNLGINNDQLLHIPGKTRAERLLVIAEQNAKARMERNMTLTDKQRDTLTAASMHPKMQARGRNDALGAIAQHWDESVNGEMTVRALIDAVLQAEHFAHDRP